MKNSWLEPLDNFFKLHLTGQHMKPERWFSGEEDAVIIDFASANTNDGKNRHSYCN
jgi:hypothetical protein